jgi:hypothetical protein
MTKRRAALYTMVFVGSTAGCATILDIDGEYDLQQRSAGRDAARVVSDEDATDASPPDDEPIFGSSDGGGFLLVDASPTQDGAPYDGHVPRAEAGREDAGSPDADGPADGRCKPGYFEGAFSGTVLPLPISPYDVAGTVTLSFERRTSDAGVENLTITEGALHGGGQQSTFEARIEGVLDCSTGQFEGTLVPAPSPARWMLLADFKGTGTNSN